ncbi:MAG: hypothetical protein N2512_12380 [Armatimonadetes bacterium]|nr:hypothetical protein [Armatimonadota bacterium]
MRLAVWTVTAFVWACFALVPCSADTWRVLDYDGAGRRVAPYLSSLGAGEAGIGAVRTAPFVLDADEVYFVICGHDGPPGQRRLRNWFALCDAETGLALRQVAPPGTDEMTPVRWDVVELVGRRVYFRAIDGVAEPAFAWMGLRAIRVGEKDMMGALVLGRLPEGWTEETRPEGLSADEWLRCRAASERYAVEMEGTPPTWGIMTTNGELRPCPPYLSSLRGGETGTGAVRSPTFVMTTPTYTFMAMGADSPTGDAGLNWFQLVDAETLEILRRAEPPVGNVLRPITWDTSDLIGRRVFFRAVDGNAAPAWAWLGCDQVPLGEGRVASFDQPDALLGWREEGQPEDALAGAVAAPRTHAEMVEADWLRQDTQRGIRWGLWESNRQAAPHIMRRLVRLMEDDFRRAEALMREFEHDGLPVSALRPLQSALRKTREKVEALQAAPQDVQAWRALRLEHRRLLRDLAFSNPRLDFDRLLFVKRFTQQSYADINVNHHAWGSRPGGDIFILKHFRPGQTPQVIPLINGRLGPGNVHGIDLDFDASRVVFAYARAASDQPPEGWLSRQATFDLHRTVDLLHLYEMKVDGSGLRQLTTGEWSDLNPCYLPNGDIAFESERCGYELNCNEYDKDEPTTNLYVLRRATGEIQRLTVTKDGDWYPRVLHDGTICYSHWEYHERGLALMHPLWFARPDGTGADDYVKQHFDFPATVTVPRPMPGSHRIIAIATGHHTLAAGPVVIVDRAVGMNNPASVIRVTGPDVWPEYGGAAPGPSAPGWRLPPGQGWYMDPYPLSETTFLAAYCDGVMQDETGYALYLLDVYGGKELIYRDPTISCVMPVPLRPRPRPPVLVSPAFPAEPEATLIVTNVTSGVPELDPGEVKFIRIAEPVPWLYDNEIGGRRYEPDAKATGVNWTPVRILGTVPVEPDGSAYFKVPADVALYFQALDAEGMELRRMRSYTSFRPGEVRSCTGCHETRDEAPPMRGVPMALARGPSTPSPPPWGSDKPLSFLRDVQPVLNRHCLRCHSGLKPAAGLDLSPGLTQDHNRAYDSLLDPRRGLIAVSNKGDNSRVTQVREFGSHASRLVKVLRGSHKEFCQLSEGDWQRLYTWLDANAVYHDDFIYKRGPLAQAYNIAEDKELWTALGAIQARRCASCHGDVPLTRPEWVDLAAPERSLFLAAPLAGAVTPSGRKCTPPPFGDRSDPDYQAILSLLREAVKKTWERPRRDLRCLAPGAEPAGVSAKAP